MRHPGGFLWAYLLPVTALPPSSPAQGGLARKAAILSVSCSR